MTTPAFYRFLSFNWKTQHCYHGWLIYEKNMIFSQMLDRFLTSVPYVYLNKKGYSQGPSLKGLKQKQTTHAVKLPFYYVCHTLEA